MRIADLAIPNSGVKMLINSVEEQMKVEASSSSCMKPLPSNQYTKNQWVVTFACEDTYFGHNPGHRPILGTSAANSNDDESSILTLVILSMIDAGERYWC